MAGTKKVSAQSLFSLKEWEEIVSRSTVAWETRKREYTRWSAAGLTSAIIFLGIFLQQLPAVPLGPQPGLSLVLLVVLVYVILHTGLELLEGRISGLVRILVTAEQEGESPWTRLRVLIQFAELNARQIVASPMVASILMTFVIVGAWILDATGAGSQPLFILVAWRFAFMLFFLVAFVIMRSWGRKLLPRKEAVLREAPRAYSPERVRQERRMAPVFEIVPGVYYVIQLILLLDALSRVAPMTYQLLMLGLSLLGSATLVAWVRGVTWPLVEYSSENFGKLRDLHSRIVSGGFGSADEVLSRVQSLLEEGQHESEA